MKSRVTSTFAIVVLAVAVCAGTSGIARADGLAANWTLNDGGAAGTTIGNGATIADAGPNGYNGTLVASGSATLTSVAGVIGTGLAFNANNSAYITTPPTANGTNLGNTNVLTISMWLNVATLPPAAGTTSELAVDLWDGGTSPNTCYEFGLRYNKSLASNNGLYYGFDAATASDHGFADSSSHQGFWARTNGTGWTANTWEQVTVEYYAGNPTGTEYGYVQAYVNGLFDGAAEINGQAAQQFPVPSASSGQVLEIGYGSGSVFDAEELNDIGIWKTDLAGAFSFSTQVNDSLGGPPSGISNGSPAGGEVGALYNVPMYNGHSGALSQYGVSAMDQLFTLFDTHAATPTAIATSNGTLTWQYVSDGTIVGGTSGYAGQLTDGQYYIQLDSSGGGVETVVAPTPEPGMLALLASALVGLLAYAWRKGK